MVSELEKFIKENPGVFEVNEPEIGHRERFLARLEESDGIKPVIKNRFPLARFSAVAGLAACVALLVLLVRPSEMDMQEDAQFREAAEYFSQELRNTADQVRLLTGYVDPAYRQEILEDIRMLEVLPTEGIPAGHIDQENRIWILFENYEARVNSLRMIENSITSIAGTGGDDQI